MNQKRRRDAIYRIFTTANAGEIRNALEWVGNDMPLFFGTEEVKESLHDPKDPRVP